MDASRDNNNIPTLLGVSNVDGVTPVKIYADPVTHRLLVDIPGGTGSVTSVAMTVPEGLTVSGSPITTAGTFDVELEVGYVIPTQAELDAKQDAITLTTTGSSGAATFIGNTLNIPQYSGGSGGQVNSVVAGTGISVNSADPINPIVSSTITQYTDEMAQDAVGTILTDSSKIDFTYDDGTPSITATIVAGSLVNADIATAAAIALSKLATLTTNRALVSDGSGVISAATTTATEIGYVNGVTSGIQTQLDGKQQALSGTGFVKISGTTISYDNSTYLTTASAASTYLTIANAATTYQPLNSNLTTYAGKTPPSGAVVGTTDTQTLENKEVVRRLATVNAPGATPGIDVDMVDIQKFTGLNTAITNMSTNLIGTPVEGQYLMIQLIDNGTARAITWGASFASTTVTLPTTTVISTLLRVGFQWNGSIWQCIAVA